MKVNLKRVNMFDVTVENGLTKRFEQVGKEWNGMLELKDKNGERLIVASNANSLNRQIDEILNDGNADFQIIKATPDFMSMVEKYGAFK